MGAIENVVFHSDIHIVRYLRAWHSRPHLNAHHKLGDERYTHNRIDYRGGRDSFQGHVRYTARTTRDGIIHEFYD